MQNILIGKYFITFTKDGNLAHQGKIVNKINEEYYLVTFFSWMSGFETNEKVVTIAEICGWNLYTDKDDLIVGMAPYK